MPTLFRYFSLRITMNPRGNEHNPPHVHAYYKEDEAIIDIRTCEIVEGYIPSSQLEIAVKFIEENKEKLLDLWEMDPQDFNSFMEN